MIETPPDSLEEFLSLPLGERCDDPRFDVRRARPEDSERVFDCVDQAFGTVRPRVAYDWLYRRNPFGRARVWIVEERGTGRILKTGSFYPWPIWRGEERLVGSLSGDAATVPEWQRKGLSNPRRIVRRSHPWSGKIATIAGPNEGSRIVTEKAGEGSSILGALTGGVAVLRAGPVLERAHVPSFVARPAGVLAGAVLSAWQKLALRRASDVPGRFEHVERFTPDYNAVTLATMSFHAYWCPHNVDFLNWRYLDHPLESYVGFALVEADRPVAYSVLRIGGLEATLAEFAAAPGDRAVKLLASTLDAARDAGCASVNFFAPPGRRCWHRRKRRSIGPIWQTRMIPRIFACSRGRWYSHGPEIRELGTRSNSRSNGFREPNGVRACSRSAGNSWPMSFRRI